MSENVIKISLQGEDSGLSKAVGGANKSIQSFGKSAATLPTGVNKAGAALNDFSRIVQDAPFTILTGNFAAVSNNINPMLESFQRLKAETGSTSTALKSMASGMLGAGGLGVAFALASSALVLFGDKIFSSGKKTEDAAKELEKYVNSLDGVTQANLKGSQAAQEQLVSLQSLYSATQNANIPLAERRKLVDELQTQYPKYFGSLTDEAILAGQGAAAYQKLSTAILNSARARAAQESLVESQKKQLTLEQKLTDAMTDEFKASVNLDKAQKARNKNTFSRDASDTDAGRTAAALQGELNEKLQKTSSITKEILSLREKDKTLIDAINQNVQANGADVLVKPGAKVTAPTIKVDKPKAEKELTDDLDGIFKKMQLADLKIALIPEIKDDGAENKRQVENYLRGTKQIFEDATAEPLISGSDLIGADINFKISEDKKKKAKEEAKAFADGVNGAVNASLQDFAVAGFAGLGEALGAALTGGGLSDAVAQLGASLGGVVEALGQQMIKLGVTALLAQKAIAAMLTNPFLAIGAGVALVALGSVIKNLAVPKLAQGGIIPPGFEGDTFPAFLNSGERVVPEGDWKKLMNNGFGGGGTSRVSIRGRELVLVQNRENKSQRRGG